MALRSEAGAKTSRTASTTDGAAMTDARGRQGRPWRRLTAPGRGPLRPRDASSSPSPLSLYLHRNTDATTSCSGEGGQSLPLPPLKTPKPTGRHCPLRRARRGNTGRDRAEEQQTDKKDASSLLSCDAERLEKHAEDDRHDGRGGNDGRHGNRGRPWRRSTAPAAVRRGQGTPASCRTGCGRGTAKPARARQRVISQRAAR